MIIESGVIIFVGLLLLFIKLPRVFALRLLGRPLALDLAVSGIATRSTGALSLARWRRAVAGLMCSGFTAVARRLIGYSRKGKVIPGVFTRPTEIGR